MQISTMHENVDLRLDEKLVYHEEENLREA